MLLAEDGFDLDDVNPSFGTYAASTFKEDWSHNPMGSMYRMWEMGRANATGESLGLTEAGKIVAESGVDVKINGTETREALELMIRRKKERADRDFLISRYDPSFINRMGMGLIAGATDPVNVAVSFIPAVGAARYARMLKGASSIAGRTGVRAGVGAVEGAIGMAAIEPLNAAADLQEGLDYTVDDFLGAIAFGSVLGSGLHTSFGTMGEAIKGFPYAAKKDAVTTAVSDLIEDKRVHAAEVLYYGTDGKPRLPRTTEEYLDSIAIKDKNQYKQQRDILSDDWFDEFVRPDAKKGETPEGRAHKAIDDYLAYTKNQNREEISLTEPQRARAARYVLKGEDIDVAIDKAQNWRYMRVAEITEREPQKPKQEAVTVDDTISDRVNDLARKSTTKSSPDRVPISKVYDAYIKANPKEKMSLEAFKAKLVELAKKRKITLLRADLPERMQRKQRERSETKWGTEEVHFVGKPKGSAKTPRAEKIGDSGFDITIPGKDTTPENPLRDRIGKAAYEAAGGRWNARALLKDVRAKLKDVDRATLDNELKQMQREERAVLYTLDNRIEITEADRKAAISVGGEGMHILWMQEPRSAAKSPIATAKVEVGDGKGHISNIWVNDKYRKQGIATEIYDYVADRFSREGRKLVPSPKAKEEGFQFWKSYDPDAVKTDIRSSRNAINAYAKKKYGKNAVVKYHEGGQTATVFRSRKSVDELTREQLIEAGVIDAEGRPVSKENRAAAYVEKWSGRDFRAEGRDPIQAAKNKVTLRRDLGEAKKLGAPEKDIAELQKLVEKNDGDVVHNMMHTGWARSHIEALRTYNRQGLMDDHIQSYATAMAAREAEARAALTGRLKSYADDVQAKDIKPKDYENDFTISQKRGDDGTLAYAQKVRAETEKQLSLLPKEKADAVREQIKQIDAAARDQETVISRVAECIFNAG